jgi:hypothetical protein
MEMPDAKILSSRLPRVEHKAGFQRHRCRADIKSKYNLKPVGIRPALYARREACQVAVFSGTLPSMEAE